MSLQFPSSPSTGQTFPAPLQPGQPSWVWDGAKWTSRGLANAMVATSPLPPLNPRVGDLWFDPVEGNTYVYFDDGNSQQWVVTINQPGDFPRMGVADGSAAVPGEIGEILFNSVTTASIPGGVGTSLFTAIVSITLSPGDWDVWGSAYGNGNANIFTVAVDTVNPNSAGGGAASPGWAQMLFPAGGMGACILPTGIITISTAVNQITSVYVAATSTMTGGGFIKARRMR